MSTPREMRARAPQGSVLSPTLYNMYTVACFPMWELLKHRNLETHATIEV
jgi:hypothetical protein